MNTHKHPRRDRLEYILRSLLGLMLMAGVAWAWVDGDKRSPDMVSSSLGN